MTECPQIEGIKAVKDWFGYWPSFHDAEVVSVFLHRSGASEVNIHAFETTSETDARGHFVTRKHAVVTFTLEGFVSDEVGSSHLEWFNHQNVLSGLVVKSVPGGYELVLDGTFGADGSLFCQGLTVDIHPGIPVGSIYENAVRLPEGSVQS